MHDVSKITANINSMYRCTERIEPQQQQQNHKESVNITTGK